MAESLDGGDPSSTHSWTDENGVVHGPDDPAQGDGGSDGGSFLSNLFSSNNDVKNTDPVTNTNDLFGSSGSGYTDIPMTAKPGKHSQQSVAKYVMEQTRVQQAKAQGARVVLERINNVGGIPVHKTTVLSPGVPGAGTYKVTFEGDLSSDGSEIPEHALEYTFPPVPGSTDGVDTQSANNPGPNTTTGGTGPGPSGSGPGGGGPTGPGSGPSGSGPMGYDVFTYPVYDSSNVVNRKDVTDKDDLIERMPVLGTLRHSPDSHVLESDYYSPDDKITTSRTIFISKTNGKFLGEIKDFTEPDEQNLVDKTQRISIRSISDGDFKYLGENNAGNNAIPKYPGSKVMISYLSQSNVVKLDTKKLIDDLNEISKPKKIDGVVVERHLYIIYDMSLNIITSDIQSYLNNTNKDSNNEYSTKGGDVSTIYNKDHPNQVIIAQAHTHPYMNQDFHSTSVYTRSETVNDKGMSDNDITFARKNKFVVYALETFQPNKMNISKVDGDGTTPLIPVTNLAEVLSGAYNLLLDAFLNYIKWHK